MHPSFTWFVCSSILPAIYLSISTSSHSSVHGFLKMLVHLLLHPFIHTFINLSDFSLPSELQMTTHSTCLKETNYELIVMNYQKSIFCFLNSTSSFTNLCFLHRHAPQNSHRNYCHQSGGLQRQLSHSDQHAQQSVLWQKDCVCHCFRWRCWS